MRFQIKETLCHWRISQISEVLYSIDLPVLKVLPAIIMASHSTVPSSVRYDPQPAFKTPLLSMLLVASSTASSELPPYC